MGIRQFITCYNLCCFILSKRDQSTFRSFLGQRQYWDSPLFLINTRTYRTHISECLLFTGRPWGDDYQSVVLSVHLAIQETTTKKPLINKLEHVLEIWVQYIFCPVFLSCPNFTHFRSRLPACLLWFLLNHFCLSYTNSESIEGSVYFFFAALSKISFIL